MDDQERNKYIELVRSATALRALMYRDILQSMQEELPKEQATRILARAIRKRGEIIGKAQFSAYAPGDFDGLCKAFIAQLPPEARAKLFANRIPRCDSEELQLVATRCPLKEAWHAAGCSDPEVAELCKLAGEIDIGMLEGAGFTIENDTWKPGREACCSLTIKRKDV